MGWRAVCGVMGRRAVFWAFGWRVYGAVKSSMGWRVVLACWLAVLLTSDKKTNGGQIVMGWRDGVVFAKNSPKSLLFCGFWAFLGGWLAYFAPFGACVRCIAGVMGWRAVGYDFLNNQKWIFGYFLIKICLFGRKFAIYKIN